MSPNVVFIIIVINHYYILYLSLKKILIRLSSRKVIFILFFISVTLSNSSLITF